MSARVWRTRRQRKLDRMLMARWDAQWEADHPKRLAAEMEHRARGFDQLCRMRSRCWANLYYPGEREAVFPAVPGNPDLRFESERRRREYIAFLHNIKPGNPNEQ